MESNATVLLITEGTYPFYNGGVSTWAHQLCQGLENFNFNLYSINANLETTSKYPLNKNIKKVTNVPMWAPEEPTEFINNPQDYTEVVLKKELTTETIITTEFVPFFKGFIEQIYEIEPSINILDKNLYNIWKFFKNHDYKKTMTSKAVWRAFNSSLLEKLSIEEGELLSMEDVTIAMRWIYRFMIPLAIPPDKADLSHVTIAGVAVLPALSLKYENNTPILLTEHGVFIRERLLAISSTAYSYFLKKLLIKFSEAFTMLSYHHASVVTTVSKFNLEWKQYYGADKSKLKVIYNGVDHELFKPMDKSEQYSTRPTVVAAARIFDLKDIKTMIWSCAEVKKSIPNVLFKVYGNKDAVPEYTVECQKLINSLDLESNFILAGFHSNPEQIYCEGELSILTSISEGFPFTVIESMSCGIPVVATDVGGVSEAIDDTCGFICKPRDYKGIAEKVVFLLQNKELREFMGFNARQKVKSQFTEHIFISGFKSTYSSLVGQKEKELSEVRWPL